MTLLPVSLAILLCAQLAASQPTISFPFNSQLPPVARIDKFFAYSFAPFTFTSTSKNISYSLGEHPDWLSLESDGRRLYGTPSDADVAPGDVVGQTVDIIARDDTGETTMKATLVVARQPPPEIEIPMAKQIGSFGKFSAPSSVLSYPSADFKFSFDAKTFGDRDLNYYATSGDGSPLPAWVHFDAPSKTFSGTTPPFKSLIQPPQAFDLNLVASDVVGFAAASLSFSVVVGSHKLTTDHPVITLNASRGTELQYSGLKNGIQIDDKPVNPGDLKVTTDRLPAWLAYDPATLRLKGTPGKEDHSTNLTISFHDPFADTLDVLVEIHVASSLFESTLDDMELQPGTYFELDLTKHLRKPNDLKVDVTMSPRQDWLKVNGLKMSGNVPKSDKGDFRISIDARSKSSGIEETEAFGVSFLALDGTTAIPKKPTSPTPTDTSESHAPTADANDAQAGHLSTGEILLATIIPIIFITILIMLLICYVRRRRARRTYLSSKYRAKMANPMASSLHAHPSEPSMREMDRIGDAAAFARTPSSRPAPLAHPEAVSQSSRRRFSGALRRLSDAGAPQSLLSDDATSATLRSIDDSSDSSDDDRQSWVTVEGDEPGPAGRSRGRARESQRSDTTFPESTHQLLPTPDIFGEARNADFRSRLDVRIPTIEDLPGAQASPNSIYKPSNSRRPSLGVYSNMTTSSVALPSVLERNYRTHARNDASMSNWETIAESEAGESASEVRRPDRALLSHKGDESRNWSYMQSSAGSKSMLTDISFESTENWRVIGGPRSGGPHQSYRDLVDDAPFNPSQAGTAREGARPGERASAEPPSPRRWSDAVSAATHHRPSASTATTMQSGPDTDVTMSGGRGDAQSESQQVLSEESGSFRVFL